MSRSSLPLGPKAHTWSLRVGVLVYPGCVRSAAVVPGDVFDVAHRVMGSRCAAGMHFELLWVSARAGGCVDSDALRFTVVPAELSRLDALIVPGMAHADARSLLDVLEPLAAERQLLQRAARAGLTVLAGCSGTALLACAGVLDGRRATTSWWLADAMRRHFPAVQLQPEQVLVHDAAWVTSAGLTSYFDLALWLVTQHAGAAVAQMVSRLLLLEGRPAGQLPYAVAAEPAAPGPVVMERARRWLARHLDKPWTVQALAEHCRTSERTLLRRFRETLGQTPVQHMQQLRVERAKRLLESTLRPFDDIAARCGYQDTAAMHRVFRKWAGVSPREYRERFGLRR